MQKFVLNYTESDGCHYFIDSFLIIEGFSKEQIISKIETLVLEKILQFSEKEWEGLSLGNIFINIGEKEIYIDNFAYYDSKENDFKFNISIDYLEDFVENNVIEMV